MLAAFGVEVLKFSRLQNIVKSLDCFKRTLLVQMKTRKLETSNRNAANNYRNRSNEEHDEEDKEAKNEDHQSNVHRDGGNKKHRSQRQ